MLSGDPTSCWSRVFSPQRLGRSNVEGRSGDMANRMKEDEKNEKIIRGLLKLPTNRKCINCNSLGPQYVCTSFWTFVCTTCSGIHREFTHRVKSVSMAKFTSKEVESLQNGGNERAKEIYFKEWDSQRHSVPDASNVERLRDFIRHVYVDRRYTGERGAERPPRAKTEDRDYSSENRRSDTYRGDSRSPSYEDVYDHRRRPEQGRYDDRNSRYGYDDKRSPRRNDDYRRSPGHLDAVDDRRRDDKFGNGNQDRKSEDRRFSDGSSRTDDRSRTHQNKSDVASPPVVRPVRDILGEDVPPLWVGDPAKLSDAKRTASSSSLGSTDGNSVEIKRVNSDNLSLIDFTAEPDPIPAAQKDSFSSPTSQVSATPSVGNNDWASFENPVMEKPVETCSNARASILEQLSAPTIPVANPLTVEMGGVGSLAASSLGGQWQGPQQKQPSLFSGADGQPANTQFLQSAAGGIPNSLPEFTVQSTQPSQVIPKQTQDSMGVSLENNPVGSKQNARKELPEDIFSLYSMPPAPIPAWQSGRQMGYGYVQYAPVQPMPTYPQSPMSTNPFDLTNESTPGPVNQAQFPSMSSLGGALPNVPTAMLMQNPALGTGTPQWMPSQVPTFPMSMTAGTNMVQQVPNSFQPTGQPDLRNVSGNVAAPIPFGADQRPTVGQSTPNAFASVSGNPFG